MQTVEEADPENSVVRRRGVARLDGLGRVRELHQPQLLSRPDDYRTYGINNRNLALDLAYQEPAYNGPSVSVTYDAMGRIVRLQGPDGALTTITYDRWKVSVIDPEGHKSVYHHDAFGGLVRVEEFLGAYGEQASSRPTVRAFQDRDRTLNVLPESAVSEVDIAGAEARQGLVVTDVLLLRPPIVTSYAYDARGNLIQIEDEEGNRVSYDVDALGQRVGMSDPDMGGAAGTAWSYSYDLNGRLSEVLDPKGQSIQWEYDDLNRPIRKAYTERTESEIDVQGQRRTVVLSREAQPPVRWRYDDREIGGPFALGRLVRMDDASGRTELVYDREGLATRVLRAIGDQTFVIHFEYDALGRPVSLRYPDRERVRYSYGRDGYLKSMRSPQETYVQTASWDAVGQRRRVRFGNGVESRFEYDRRTQGHQRVSRITAGYSGTAQAPDDGSPLAVFLPLLDVRYSYDRVGNVLERRSGTTTTSADSYFYDELDRLVKVIRDGESRRYEYDSLGNLTAMGGIEHDYARPLRAAKPGTVSPRPRRRPASRRAPPPRRPGRRRARGWRRRPRPAYRTRSTRSGPRGRGCRSSYRSEPGRWGARRRADRRSRSRCDRAGDTLLRTW